MKNVKSLLFTNLFALMLLSTSQLLATSITSLEIVKAKEEKAFVLSIKSQGQGKAKIKFLDENQNILFSSKIDPTKLFEKKFNLSSLEVGKYTLQVEDELKTTLQPVAINYDGIDINYDSRQVVYKPQLKYNEVKEQLFVNWLINENANFQLDIYDNDLNLLYSHTIKDVFNINKVYTLSQLPRGNYLLKVRGANQVYAKNIEVKG